MSISPQIYLPDIKIPPIQNYETISIPLPTADVPSYIPMVIPPSDLEAPEGVEAEANDEPEATGIRKVDIPFTDLKMPVPENEILVLSLIHI